MESTKNMFSERSEMLNVFISDPGVYVQGISKLEIE